ncbi:2-phospho-L-lactate guanylyltransferase (plasmid) [Streptosporangium sp. CA-135522]|uniref:2-phospho-L-lactate guanylyltransferase n=1 Tax=Streptosporangium sp. CA-135522 TaxID=3240072 RepID=UPI003D932E14
MERGVDLVVPIKNLDRAKSRLRGTVPAHKHAGLVLTLLLDTVTAAAQAGGVRRVLVICEDERIPAALAGTGVECVDERGLPGLNAALRFGAAYLRTPGSTVGALQADLPALRPADLSAAIEEAAGRRAYCADRPGTGTTLLLAAPGEPLHPSFGPRSADAHAATGAVRVGGSLASLRCDVDTEDDLAIAAQIGLGKFTLPFDHAITRWSEEADADWTEDRASEVRARPRARRRQDNIRQICEATSSTQEER